MFYESVGFLLDIVDHGLHSPYDISRVEAEDLTLHSSFYTGSTRKLCPVIRLS